jgi:hypothetical protein
MTVYKFTIHYKGDETFTPQARFVVAHDEDEAVSKMERYRQRCIKVGIDDFTYSAYPTVEIDSVIYF